MMTASIIEMDEERDRKTCVQLDLKVTGPNHELAQWLLDHPRYPNTVVARWLGCNESRIRKLRQWAKEGFVGIYDKSHSKPKSPKSANPTLKSQDNPEGGDALEAALEGAQEV